MKKKNFINIIVFLLIITYVFVGTDFKNDIKKASADMSNISKQTTKVKKTVNVTGDLIVSFIDVGQADSILIQNNNHNMLIDAGNNEDGEKLVSYFKENNINIIDSLEAFDKIITIFLIKLLNIDCTLPNEPKFYINGNYIDNSKEYISKFIKK